MVLEEDVKPTVLCTLEVPTALMLDPMHLTMQAAMGRDNQHLYDFSAGRSTR